MGLKNQNSEAGLEAAHMLQENVESLIQMMKQERHNFSGHLNKAENIQQNIQALIELTLKVQSGRTNYIYQLK